MLWLAGALDALAVVALLLAWALLEQAYQWLRAHGASPEREVHLTHLGEIGWVMLGAGVLVLAALGAVVLALGGL